MLVFVVALIAGASAGWAIGTVFHPASVPSSRAAFLYSRVTTGSVGGSIAVNASATWSSGFTARNRAAGTVTSIPASSESPDAPGTVLYTVDLRPVVVAQGAVPSFRDLAAGAIGPDVAQLESLLRALGHYNGALDARFTPAVQRAVLAWHRSIGLGSDPAVPESDIVYVPALPARLTLVRSLIEVGRTVAGGEAGIRVLAAAPEFSLVLAGSQDSAIPPKAVVTLHPGSGAVWKAHVGRIVSTTNGVTISLTPSGPSPICADRCNEITTSGTTLIPADVATTPTVSGLTLPTAAVQTDDRNRAFVVDTRGVHHTVRVRASSDGISVVTGVRPGMRVRVVTLASDQ